MKKFNIIFNGVMIIVELVFMFTNAHNNNIPMTICYGFCSMLFAILFTCSEKL